MDIYGISSNTWKNATLSEGRWFLAAATVENLALFGSGWVNVGTPTSLVDIFIPCMIDSDCDDHIFCDGLEVRQSGFCSNFGNACVGAICNNTCNENAKNCFSPIGTSCNDNIFCNGIDTCDGSGACIHPGNPCVMNSNLCNNTCIFINHHTLIYLAVTLQG